MTTYAADPQAARAPAKQWAGAAAARNGLMRMSSLEVRQRLVAQCCAQPMLAVQAVASPCLPCLAACSLPAASQQAALPVPHSSAGGPLASLHVGKAARSAQVGSACMTWGSWSSAGLCMLWAISCPESRPDLRCTFVAPLVRQVAPLATHAPAHNLGGVPAVPQLSQPALAALASAFAAASNQQGAGGAVLGVSGLVQTSGRAGVSEVPELGRGKRQRAAVKKVRVRQWRH